MRQLLILSGKGGTGKTTIASAFIKLSDTKAYADCDVDAPNLHLISNWNTAPKKSDYYGLPKAKINNEACINCDLCREHCRFSAISIENEKYVVDGFSCEGCGVCEFVCPQNAVKLYPCASGELMLYKDEGRIFSTAELKAGNGTSGLLVTEVKKSLKEAKAFASFSIIDGSPGIGCPVIASLNGADMLLIVAEPSVSGISDMDRIIKTASNFDIKTAVCINKYDTNEDMTRQIEKYCKDKSIYMLGKIPYDTNAIKAINQGKTISEIDCPSGKAVKDIYKKALDFYNIM